MCVCSGCSLPLSKEEVEGQADQSQGNARHSEDGVDHGEGDGHRGEGGEGGAVWRGSICVRV